MMATKAIHTMIYEDGTDPRTNLTGLLKVLYKTSLTSDKTLTGPISFDSVGK